MRRLPSFPYTYKEAYMKLAAINNFHRPRARNIRSYKLDVLTTRPRIHG